MPELTLDRITKHFKNKIAVDHVSICLQDGVYGFLGANGAGKTTLLRMIGTTEFQLTNWTVITVIFWGTCLRISDIIRTLPPDGTWNIWRHAKLSLQISRKKRCRNFSA